MPCEIIWLADAARDVAHLRQFIEEKNPRAAERAAGKPVEDIPRFRDLYVPFGSGNYIVRYRHEEQRIIVIRVRHNREESF